MLRFWANVVGNQLVWLCAVVGAGRGLRWPALLAATLYVITQLAWSPQPRVELKVMALAIGCGLLVDGIAAGSGRVLYAAGNTPTWLSPLWILALWASFAMTVTVSLALLQRHLRVAALVGLLLAPLAYLSAARGWGAVQFTAPVWQGVVLLGLGWSLALPLLAACAGRWQRGTASLPATLQGEAP